MASSDPRDDTQFYTDPRENEDDQFGDIPIDTLYEEDYENLLKRPDTAFLGQIGPKQSESDEPGYHQGSGLGGAFFNMLKSYLGIGMLTLPFSFVCAGATPGVVLLMFLAFLSAHTSTILIELKDIMLLERKHIRQMSIGESLSPPGSPMSRSYAAKHTKLEPISYSDIGERACGNSGRWIAQAAIILSNFGLGIGYLIFVGSSLHSTWAPTPNWGMWHPLGNRTLL